MMSHGRCLAPFGRLLRAPLVIATLAFPSMAAAESGEDPALTIVLSSDGGAFGVGYGSLTADADPVILDPHLTQLPAVPDAPTPPTIRDDCAAAAKNGAVKSYIAEARAYSVAKSDALSACAGELGGVLDAIDALATIDPSAPPGTADGYGVLIAGRDRVPVEHADRIRSVCAVNYIEDIRGRFVGPESCTVCAYGVGLLAGVTNWLADDFTQCSEFVLQAESIRLDVEAELQEGVVTAETYCRLASVPSLQAVAARLGRDATRARNEALDPGIDGYCSAAAAAASCAACDAPPAPIGGLSGVVREMATPGSLLQRLRAHFKGAAASTKDAALAARYTVIANALARSTGVRHFVFPAIGSVNVRYVVLADPASDQATKIFIATGLVGGAPGNPFDVAELQRLWSDVRSIRGAAPSSCKVDADCAAKARCSDSQCVTW